MPNCIVPDCLGPTIGKGLCRKHYLRQYRHGDVNFVSDRRDYIAKGAASTQYKHGQWRHPLYKTWCNMLSRCENPNDHAYSNYGGRGISVCPEWHDINSFVLDMGPRPDGASLDRINGDGNYEPSNCRWASMTTQSRNRNFAKLTKATADEMRALRGTATRADLATKFGVSVATVKKVFSGAYWK